jgi:hypothetical protein
VDEAGMKEQADGQANDGERPGTSQLYRRAHDLFVAEIMSGVKNILEKRRSSDARSIY